MSMPSATTIQRWIEDGTEQQRRAHMYAVREARKRARDAAPAGWMFAARFYRECGNYPAARTVIATARVLPLPGGAS